MTITDTAARGREVVDEAVSSYVSDEHRPAGRLFVLGGVFGLAFVGSLLGAKRRADSASR